MTKFLLGLTTRQHRKLIGVKTMCLGAHCGLYCLKCCQYFRNAITSYQDNCLMPWSSIKKVIKSGSKRFYRYRRVTRRQVMRRLTRNGTDKCRHDSSNLFTPYLEQLRSIRTVVAYARPAFSATKGPAFSTTSSPSFSRPNVVQK